MKKSEVLKIQNELIKEYNDGNVPAGIVTALLLCELVLRSPSVKDDWSSEEKQ